MLMNEPRRNSVRQVKDSMLKDQGMWHFVLLAWGLCKSAFRRHLWNWHFCTWYPCGCVANMLNSGPFCNVEKVKSFHYWFTWELLSATSVHPTQVDLICSNFLVIMHIDMERTFFPSLLSWKKKKKRTTTHFLHLNLMHIHQWQRWRVACWRVRRVKTALFGIILGK